MPKTGLSLALLPLLLISCSCGPKARPESAHATIAPAATAASGKVDGTIAPASAMSLPDQVLRLTLTDEHAGDAVYHAGLNLLNSKSLQWTDRDGHWQWSGGGFATVGAIEIRCPARRAETGRKIDSVAYEMKGPLTNVSASIDTSQCIEPPEKSKTGAYAGTLYRYYANGYFVPCAGLPEDASFYGNSKSAWVNFGGSTLNDLKKLLSADDNVPDTSQPIHVEWTGTLTGPGAYGAVGANAYRMNVTAVAKASTEMPDDCPAATLE